MPGMPSGGAPYPTMNGTAPFVPGSSGFLTATKPAASGAVPTGGMPGMSYGAPAPSGSSVVAVPSGTATGTLPPFVLPSATPAGESPSAGASTTTSAAGESATSVSPESPSALPSGSYGGGYGYGSKKRSFFGIF
jgi:hypothetical protein